MRKDQTPAKAMPKGGRKGGSVFPRISLKDAVDYSRKLVSKTHTGPQPQDIIFSGVVGAKSGTGNVRVSALKQYGFLQGDTKSGYLADDLAKKIASAPPEELLQLYRSAALKPAIFKRIYATYHGDTISKAKLKQRASDLNVHPDETAKCIEIYLKGMLFAELVTIDGDSVTHLNLQDVEVVDDANTPAEQIAKNSEKADSAPPEEQAAPNTSNEQHSDSLRENKDSTESAHTPRAIFNVNVTLDSSLDIEKLQKQLDLLRRFGAI